MPIELSDEPLTDEELEWMNRVDSWGGILNIVGVVAIVGAVTSPFMLLFGGKK